MIRHDEHFLQLIHKHINEKTFRKIQQIPFFYFELPSKFLINSKYANIPYLQELVPPDLNFTEVLPFRNFSFILANDPCLHIFEYFEYTDKTEGKILLYDFFLPKSYNNVEENTFNSRKDFLPTIGNESNHYKKVNRGLWIHNHCRASTPTDTEGHNYSCLIQQFYNRKKVLEIDLNEYVNGKDSKASEIMAQNNNDMRSILFTILGVFVLAEEKNQHLIKVRSKPTTNYNKSKTYYSSKYSPKHHYIYLDGPPAHVMSEEQREATGRTVRGHARRAHWHRLKHERFKNHPNFGQRIRIKASWVGPKEWSDAGKIYTLHNPEAL